MPADLELLGGADTVTGSCSILKFKGKQYLIDCGLFQGQKELRQRNWRPFPRDVSMLDGVILTHAHLDHSGYLPRLVKEGYRGPIYATAGTIDLCNILLPDAAYLEMEQAQFANKAGYSHHKPAYPLFTDEDAYNALKLMQVCPRNEWQEVAAGLNFRFLRAGHIIGSSMVELAISNGQGLHLLTFTGDLGHERSLLLKGPENLLAANTLVLESTYGSRLHSRENTFKVMAKIVNETVSKGGVLLIPAFAVGRTQEILYLLKYLQDEKLIPLVPIVLDSPMANAATNILLEHSEDHILDSVFLKNHGSLFPETFVASVSVDESMYYCMHEGPLIVISAAGMLSGGRILHHLKARLPYQENTLLFTGYQAEGTKGRFLQDHKDKLDSLRIFHDEVAVNCNIVTLDALSAHADYEDILRWLGQIKQKPEHIIVNHGHPTAQSELAKKIYEKFAIKVSIAAEITFFHLA